MLSSAPAHGIHSWRTGLPKATQRRRQHGGRHGLLRETECLAERRKAVETDAERHVAIAAVIALNAR